MVLTVQLACSTAWNRSVRPPALAGTDAGKLAWPSPSATALPASFAAPIVTLPAQWGIGVEPGRTPYAKEIVAEGVAPVTSRVFVVWIRHGKGPLRTNPSAIV